MTLSYAEMKNKKMFLPALGCDKTSDVVGCLLSKSGKELTDNMPQYFDPVGLVPSDKGGSDYGPLVIVDGVTVKKSIADLLQSSRDDLGIGMIFQSTFGEIFPLFVNESIADMSLEQYKAFIRSEYRVQKGWDSKVADMILSLYSNEMAQENAAYLAYSAFSSDVWLAGGNGVLGKIAATFWKKSEVYVGSVLYPPSKPYCFIFPKYPISIPFHMWDYLAASLSFNVSLTPDCDNSNYVPSNADLTFSAQIQSQWKAMIYNGSLINSGINWKPMTPTNHNVGAIYSNFVLNQPYEKFRHGIWATLEKSPLMLNTQQYWLVN